MPFLLLLSLPTLAATPSPRPNVILILADDFGYECVGANGGTSYKTPTLDKLAATGVRFEHCYAQPLCTPTRVQLMTGIYNVRNYVDFGNMDPKSVTFANLFKNAGYATGICGKWQLGHDRDLPRRFGFDESFLWQHTRRPPRYANPGLEINGKEVDYTDGEYGPDLVNDFVRDFVRRHRDEPFFLYYPMTLTHDPFQPTPDSKDWDPKAKGEQVNRKPAHFADMVAYMDKLIGKLVATLDETGTRQNTLILFVGDNGTGKGIRSLMGERLVVGGKGTTTDAGTHVPLIVNWPAGMTTPRVCSDLVDSTDFLPTICAAAGVAVPAELKIDGRSFLPQLRGEAGDPRTYAYIWYSRNGGAANARECAFDRRYKLYRTGEFYDRSADADEQRQLKAETLDPGAAAARKALQGALDRYRDARPAHLRKGKRNAAADDD
ncbi:MAG TPA: sulfatase-like hydrolase/transferase [Tepidisphaeraceae bacterium]|nr:sulfatase-like hydrolase/transferase [Tepidisphaeraceae bacterium]